MFAEVACFVRSLLKFARDFLEVFLAFPNAALVLLKFSLGFAKSMFSSFFVS